MASSLADAERFSAETRAQWRAWLEQDLAAAFDAVPGSHEQWEAFPRSAKRALLEWIVQAKTPPTRAKRIAATAEAAGRGEHANSWRPKG